MACGVPVVTSNVFGPSEIVTDGLDGLTVPPDDPQALAAAVERLLDSDALRSQLGRNAENTVQRRFDLVDHTRKLLSMYSSLGTPH
jgi:glycosyltransferase involved in cell wall biosynthesis